MTAMLSLETVTDADRWRAMVSEQFIPLDIRVGGASFTGSLGVHDLGADVTVSLVRNSPATIVRTTEGIDEGDDNSLFLSLSRAEPFTIAQEGRLAQLGRGSGAFSASFLPYDLICPRPIEQIVVKLARDSLPVAWSLQRDVLARPFEAGHEEMSFLRSFVESVLHSVGDLDHSANQVLRQTLLDLAALTIHSAVGESAPQHMERTSLYHAMLAFIRANAHDPRLNSQTLADRFFVSRRLVFHVFEDNGTTPAREIRSERLRRTRLLLSSTRLSISKVAHQAGFADVSTFTRAFQREYGALPSLWRRIGPEEQPA